MMEFESSRSDWGESGSEKGGKGFEGPKVDVFIRWWPGSGKGIGGNGGTETFDRSAVLGDASEGPWSVSSSRGSPNCWLPKWILFLSNDGEIGGLGFSTAKFLVCGVLFWPENKFVPSSSSLCDESPAFFSRLLVSMVGASRELVRMGTFKLQDGRFELPRVVGVCPRICILADDLLPSVGGYSLEFSAAEPRPDPT